MASPRWRRRPMSPGIRPFVAPIGPRIGRDVTASVYPNAAWAETVAAKIADLRVFDAIKNAIPTGDVTSGPSADPEEFVANDNTIPEKVPDTFSVPTTVRQRMPISRPMPMRFPMTIRKKSRRSNRKPYRRTRPKLPTIRRRTQPAGSAHPTDRSNLESSYWPVPTALMAQLNRLSADPDCKNWVDNVKALCLEVCRTSPTDLQRAAPLHSSIAIARRSGRHIGRHA